MAVNQTAISAQLATSLSAVQAAIAAVDDIATASPFELQPAATAVAAEISTLQAAIAQFDADIIADSVAGIVSGEPAPTQWPLLLNQVSNSAQIATLLNALGYLQRLSTNLAQVAIAQAPAQIKFAPIPPTPPLSGGASLDFSDPSNSQYLPAL